MMEEDPYIDEETLDRARDEKFSQWFKENIQSNDGNELLKVLARGPMRYVESYKDYDYDNGSIGRGRGRGKSGNTYGHGSSSTFGCGNPDADYDNGTHGDTNDNATETSQH
ncbi:hypothetical protein Tco_0617683, partial [Tanacetum coccineum]